MHTSQDMRPIQLADATTVAAVLLLIGGPTWAIPIAILLTLGALAYLGRRTNTRA